MIGKSTAVAAVMVGAIALGAGTASAAATSFGDGTHLVGTHIRPGVYESQWSDSCYWERLSGLSGDLDDIIANDFASGRQVVRIYYSDTAFKSSRCGTWTRLPDPPAPPPPPPPGPMDFVAPAIGSMLVSSLVMPQLPVALLYGSMSMS
ncbi:hypothetical protein [Rhodococcus spongiicola]|uniref:Uncharacterized protein n=1 Tax=Rhodococcus spongiicola TaxID=2487352 RepID=A0A3S3CN51_9NOCA|nr:hypothetical protein [Rhodococcus spongiicola]RVW01550.1 hypothetical protein EF834_14070 [Rhodococcus spongiicola]